MATDRHKKKYTHIYHILSFIRWNEIVFDPLFWYGHLQLQNVSKINRQYQEIDKNWAYNSLPHYVGKHVQELSNLSTNSSSRTGIFTLSFAKIILISFTNEMTMNNCEQTMNKYLLKQNEIENGINYFRTIMKIRILIIFWIRLISGENSQLDDLYTRYRQRLRKSLFESGLSTAFVACIICLCVLLSNQVVEFKFSYSSPSIKMSFKIQASTLNW